jgi:hypothetical protein
MVGFRPEEEGDTAMLASPRTVYLSVAATKPQARDAVSALRSPGMVWSRRVKMALKFATPIGSVPTCWHPAFGRDLDSRMRLIAWQKPSIP